MNLLLPNIFAILTCVFAFGFILGTMYGKDKPLT